MTTVGYGDISPVSPQEMLFAVVVQLLGVSFCFAILNNAVSAIYHEREIFDTDGL